MLRTKIQTLRKEETNTELKQLPVRPAAGGGAESESGAVGAEPECA